MPVPPVGDGPGLVGGPDDEVRRPGPDLVVAAGAAVELGGLRPGHGPHEPVTIRPGLGPSPPGSGTKLPLRRRPTVRAAAGTVASRHEPTVTATAQADRHRSGRLRGLPSPASVGPAPPDLAPLAWQPSADRHRFGRFRVGGGPGTCRPGPTRPRRPRPCSPLAQHLPTRPDPGAPWPGRPLRPWPGSPSPGSLGSAPADPTPAPSGAQQPLAQQPLARHLSARPGPGTPWPGSSARPARPGEVQVPPRLPGPARWPRRPISRLRGHLHPAPIGNLARPRPAPRGSELYPAHPTSCRPVNPAPSAHPARVSDPPRSQATRRYHRASQVTRSPRAKATPTPRGPLPAAVRHPSWPQPPAPRGLKPPGPPPRAHPPAGARSPRGRAPPTRAAPGCARSAGSPPRRAPT